jgi:hypothetical protein
MATLISSSGTSPSGRALPFRVTTREISSDFSTVGPDQSPVELGGLSASAFGELIEKFAAIPAVKLIDGDPQLIVTAKRGRYVILPSTGSLLLRPANDAQQPYVKFAPADVPAFLDNTDRQEQAQSPAKNFQTLIGSAANIVATAEASSPEVPLAPIYGAFPEKVGRLVSNAPFPSSTAPAPAAPGPLKISRRLIITLVSLVLVVAAATLWVYYGPAPADSPLPPAPPSEFDLVTAPEQLASLSKRFAGTYATSGTDGERLIELRANGTFHYQEFGAGLARNNNRTGTYVFAYRHGTKTPLIRASGLGTIEILDEKKLFCQRAVFTRLP